MQAVFDHGIMGSLTRTFPCISKENRKKRRNREKIMFLSKKTAFVIAK